jgi:Cu(I)/Ag(I) efflux system membrane fusion protein
VDGRIEKLFADYTGVVVREGDCLALVYSPELYSAQVEYLLSLGQRASGLSGAGAGSGAAAGGGLLESSRRRLLALGMTEQQAEELESGGEASSRLQMVAPISGTVVEKLAVEGQYVREGEAVFQLADSSAVWLILELFPEDGRSRFGQRVHVEVQSLPGRRIEGRVVFVAPRVTPETRTVGVRVVLPNEDGELRVGDYAPC